MATPYFSFKKFQIWHDKCAMKVGTDAVLLGAWASVPEEGRVLDVGCGSGVISLMVAQRFPSTSITGVDIVEEAVVQSRDNAAISGFANPMEFICSDIVQYASAHLGEFDAVVSNPPFYANALRSPDAKRATARQTDSLSFELLIDSSSKLLKDEGRFSVVIPNAEADDFIFSCWLKGLVLIRHTQVFSKEQTEPKRSLLLFCKSTKKTNPLTDEIYIRNGGEYTKEYRRLTEDFYLDF